jgi:enoyl-CoA hydratase
MKRQEGQRMAVDDELLCEARGSVLWLTLNRPQARNALTFAMYEKLARTCREVPLDGRVRAIVVCGAGGRAFAAGTDIAQFTDVRTAAEALDYEARVDAVLEAIEMCPLPTIAALHGACTGGGAAIAAACDLRIASAALRFGFPIARTLGNCLSTRNLARLSEAIGAARLRELIFTARLMEADEALAIGLVAAVLPDEEALLRHAAELANHVGGMAPLTLRATKEGLRRNRPPAAADADLIAMCYTSVDFRTGIEAFLAKESPEWQGR